MRELPIYTDEHSRAGCKTCVQLCYLTAELDSALRRAVLTDDDAESDFSRVRVDIELGDLVFAARGGPEIRTTSRTSSDARHTA